jgi:hypothetical protein
LVAASVFVSHIGHFCQVALLGSFARFDESLKTETGMTFACGKLAHGEAKKVKSGHFIPPPVKAPCIPGK